MSHNLNVIQGKNRSNFLIISFHRIIHQNRQLAKVGEAR